MKKRLLSLVLTVLLILGCTSIANGSELVCFIGVNDTIPTSLPGEASPYYDNGTLYIPCTAFDASPNDIYTRFDAKQNTFLISRGNQFLVYDLSNDAIMDENGVFYETSVRYRGGLLFLPGIFAANYFGLNISILYSQTGCPILRFTNGSQIYDDATFVNKAESLIAYVLDHYENKEEDRPKNPDFIEVQEEEKDPEQEETDPGEVYLAFIGSALEKDTLMHLEALNAKAVFFATEQQLLEQPEVIRSIYGRGHQIGITIEAGESDVAAGLERANKALDHVLFFKTLLVYVPDDFSSSMYTEFQPKDCSTTDQILEHPENSHLLLCQEDVLETLSLLVTQKLRYPQLTETTSFHH